MVFADLGHNTDEVYPHFIKISSQLRPNSHLFHGFLHVLHILMIYDVDHNVRRLRELGTSPSDKEKKRTYQTESRVATTYRFTYPSYIY
jgi:hypothetical protein